MVVSPFEARVYDEYVVRGNTAVLSCVVPAFVKEHVTVSAWMRDPAYHIYPSTYGGEASILVYLSMGRGEYE